jgi:hypothetical protein
MSVSAADAVSQAVERTKRILFPFKFEKWLGLGFVAFLAGLSEGGGLSGKFPSLPSGPSSGSTPGTASSDPWATFDEPLNWIRDHLTLVIVLGSVVALLSIALGLTITWISSRGKLMFIESVIHDRYTVREPWTRLREPAWAVFKFRVLLGVASFLLLAVAAGVGIVIALPSIHAREFGAPAIIGLLSAFGIMLVSTLPLYIVLALLDDFVLPILYVRGVGLREAWDIFRNQVLPGNGGNIVVFFLLSFALGMAGAVVTMFAMCVTCCLAALPFVGTVVLLPLHVFYRAFSLHFLEQLGIKVFPEQPLPFGAFSSGSF